MAVRKPSFIDTTEGFQQELDTSVDGLDLGNAAQVAGDLTYSGGGEPRGLPTVPTASDAGASRAYVDSIVFANRSWREVILVAEQLLNGGSGGVLQALTLYVDSLPTANDTFVISDGSTTETFTFKASEAVAFDVEIGVSVAACLTNLVQAINDDSTLWSAVETSGLDQYFVADPAGQAVVYRTATSAADDRVYGSSTTASQIKVVKFDTVDKQNYEIASGTEENLPSSDPSAKTFGFGRLFADLATNETHSVVETISQYVWNVDDEIWNQGDASAIAGGAGILRTGSNLDVELDTTAAATGAGSLGGSSGLEFDTTGAAAKLRAAVSATGAIERAGDGLAINIEATTPSLEIVANEIGVKEDTTRGLATDGSGLYVKADGSSVTFNGSGELQVNGVNESQRIENDLTVNAAVAVADPVHWSSTADRVEPSDADNDSESRVVGVATTAQASAGSDATVVSHGAAAGVLTGATPGTPYYLQSGGGIGTSVPAGNKRIVQVGIALNTTDLWVRIIDFGKKAA